MNFSSHGCIDQDPVSRSIIRSLHDSNHSSKGDNYVLYDHLFFRMVPEVGGRSCLEKLPKAMGSRGELLSRLYVSHVIQNEATLHFGVTISSFVSFKRPTAEFGRKGDNNSGYQE